jgi:hypothetical protein
MILKELTPPMAIMLECKHLDKKIKMQILVSLLQIVTLILQLNKQELM